MRTSSSFLVHAGAVRDGAQEHRLPPREAPVMMPPQDADRHASRPWTQRERRVVVRGFLGRCSIAVEPLVIALFFAALPVAMLLRGQQIVKLVAPIFAFGALGFMAYAVVLMLPSTRALIDSFGRISIIDGYIRYRCVPEGKDRYYVAVLDERRRQLGEWELAGRPAALDRAELWPALVEFSPHGGIFRIDGRPTGGSPTTSPRWGSGHRPPGQTTTPMRV